MVRIVTEDHFVGYHLHQIGAVHILIMELQSSRDQTLHRSHITRYVILLWYLHSDYYFL